MTQYRANLSDSSIAMQHLAYLLYTIRCNLMHGGKTYHSENSQQVVDHAIPLLCEIVVALRETDMAQQSPNRNALP